MVQIKKVLFPTDFSDLASQALHYAVDLAERYTAELHVLHVVDEAYRYWMAMGPGSLPVGPPPDEMVNIAEGELSKFVSTRLAKLRIPIVREVAVGRPFLEIIRYARERGIDMIVMGTHGHSGLRHALLGSVAERVVRKSPCPVMTIRDPSHEFEMP